MLVLDTNHLREFGYESLLGTRLEQRLTATSDSPVITVVSADEMLRGRLAQVAAARTVAEQVVAYRRLSQLIATVAKFILLPWDEEAAARFQRFRAQGIRIGTMDLRIACITLEHDATLLTRNTVDFHQSAGPARRELAGLTASLAWEKAALRDGVD